MTIEPPSRSRLFRLGINYWPARTAMRWWPAYDRAEVEADFTRIAAAGFDSVRLFVTWEDFQPQRDQVVKRMIERLVTTLDCASGAALTVMPTLFTGHMSGVNWIPGWALGGAEGDRRFRIVSGGRVVEAGLRNWYAETPIARAQAFLAGELARALAGHPALWAWDLGNENSNCVIPPTREQARDWLTRVSDAIREGDGSVPLTLGLHMEDLEQDRKLGPAEAAQVCDFLTMHGYPGYASWARGPTDEEALPFLASVTRWLGGGADVLFSELGVPTYREGHGQRGAIACATPLVEEQAAAAYIGRALEALLACGCTGAMLWCHADYSEASWRLPPLDLAIHERFFGQWRADASPKPALAAVEALAKRRRAAMAPIGSASWLDLDPSHFYHGGASRLPELYRRYLERAPERADAAMTPC
jgi:endo-1,4-beta-mannosidase